MASFALDIDPGLILIRLLEAIESGNVGPLIEGGFRPELLDRIRAMSSNQMTRLLASRGRPFYRIELDVREIESAVLHTDLKASQDDMLGYFIEHGAAIATIRRLFKLSRDQASRYRALICEQSTGGRPRLPSEPERDAIHRRWAQLRREVSDERMRYIQLHKHFPTYSLSILESALREFEPTKAIS